MRGTAKSETPCLYTHSRARLASFANLGSESEGIIPQVRRDTAFASMGGPVSANSQWIWSESEDEELIFTKPPHVYSERVKEILDLLHDPAKTDTIKILAIYKKVGSWRDDDKIPQIVRDMEKEQQRKPASSSSSPTPATDPVEDRGLKRLADTQLEPIAKNKKAAQERKMQMQMEECAADVAKWNMRWTPSLQQL